MSAELEALKRSAAVALRAGNPFGLTLCELAGRHLDLRVTRSRWRRRVVHVKCHQCGEESS